jgi:cell division septal protein FtsQ
MAEEPAAEPYTPVESEPRFTFRSSPAPEEEPLPVQPAAKKNGTRRLAMILVSILLLLSLGYLAWQLWPILGDKVREWVSYLKQLL